MGEETRPEELTESEPFPHKFPGFFMWPPGASS